MISKSIETDSVNNGIINEKAVINMDGNKDSDMEIITLLFCFTATVSFIQSVKPCLRSFINPSCAIKNV